MAISINSEMFTNFVKMGQDAQKQLEASKQRFLESKSVVPDDSSQEPIKIRPRVTRDIFSLSSGEKSTTDNQQQTFEAYSPVNIGETDSSASSSNRGMRISNGATKADLSNAGTSNAISSDSSSADINSQASQKRLHSSRLQPAQAYQQAVAAQLAEANQAPQSVLNLFG